MRKRLFLLASAGMLPLAVACALGFFKIAQAEQQKDDEAGRSLVSGIAMSVEVELGGSMAVLQALSTSTLLDTRQLDDYGRLTERVLQTRPQWYRINLFTPAGEMVATAGRPGARANTGVVERGSFAEMLATQQPRWGYMAKGPAGGLAVPLRVPVLRDGALRYVLTAVVRADSLTDLLQRQPLPEGTYAVVLDGRQQVVATSSPAFATPGEPLPAQAQARGRTYSAALPSDWRVLAVHDAPATWAARHVGLVPYAVGLSLSLLLAFGLSWWLAARISRPIGRLRTAALALGRGETPPPNDTSITELREVADALHASSRQLRDAQAERGRLQAAEQAARDRLDRLGRAGVALSHTLEQHEMLALLGHALVPALGDGAGIALQGESGPLCDVHAVGCTDPEQVRPLHVETIAVQGEAFGEVRLYGHPARAALNADDLLLLHELVMRTALALRNAGLYRKALQAQAQAERANQGKDHFIAMLGHELRNPLAAIGSTLSLMAMRDPQAFVRERAILERQTDQLSRLVDDLLDVSRLMRGKLELRSAPVLLNRLVRDASEAAAALHGPERIDITLPDEAVWVLGDAARLEQVLGNLLSNALKFSPAARPVRVVLRHDHLAHMAWVEVCDEGEGIAAELLPFVFEPFVQGQQSLHRSRGGLGLGLAIVKELVERHGGSVLASSAGAGAGASFLVRLPTTAAPDPAGKAPAPAAATLPQRVLLVDDEHDILESLSLLLTFEGMEVRTASSAAEAQAVLAAWQPDAVVLDIGLPDEDGYALARRLRASPPTPFALIAMTGYGQQADRDSATAAGFDVHLTKPVKAETLLETLARCRAG